MTNIEIHKDLFFPNHWSAIVEKGDIDTPWHTVHVIGYGKTPMGALRNLTEKLKNLTRECS